MKPFLLSVALLCACFNISFAQHAVFDTVTSYYTSGEREVLAVGDINNDGLNDIIAAQDSLAIWLQQPGGTLAAPIKIYATNPDFDKVLALRVTDLDSDGTSNIIVGSYYDLKMYEWNSGVLTLTDSINIGVAVGSGITINDFDGDGYKDIAFVNTGNSFIEVMFRNAELTNKWDIRHFDIGATSFNQVISGVFGGLTRPALIHQGIGTAISVLTFSSARTLIQHDTLDIFPPYRNRPNSIAIVNKGAGNINELWAAYGGNQPTSQVAVWRGLQTIPDSVFNVYDVPEAIQSDNLDCDDDDEPVIFHGGWVRATIFTDTAMAGYSIPYFLHTNNSAMVLGDVNNDGLKDICFVYNTNYLGIMYNITNPCPVTGIVPISSTFNTLSVYPNPTYNTVDVEYEGNGKLSLTDVQGKILLYSNFNQRATIDLSGQASGLYLLKLQTGDGQTFTQKIIKQ